MSKIISLDQYDEYISIEQLAKQLLQYKIARSGAFSSGNWIEDLNTNIDNERKKRLAIDAKLAEDQISGHLMTTEIRGQKVVLPSDLVKWAELNQYEVIQKPKPRREQSLVDIAYSQLLADEAEPDAKTAPEDDSRPQSGTGSESNLWSDQDLAKLLESHDKLKASGEKAPTKKLAEESGISHTRLRELLIKARKLAIAAGTAPAGSPKEHAPFGLGRRS